jgi:branched-chain amino acid transport system permease protein
VPLAARYGPETYILSLFDRVVILGLAALSLDLIIGFGGLVSFGHAAFIGIGVYSVGILAKAGVTDLPIQAATAACVALLYAAATGAIAMRTRGVYFIMITLAFNQMLFFLATSLSAYGGDDGFTLDTRSTLFGQAAFTGERAFYYLCLAALLAAYLLCRRVVAARFGRVLRAARENAVRVQAVGLEPFRFLLTAYVGAGVLAALAGVLLANASAFISPASMSWQRSGDLIFMVVLGGLGTLHGPLIGAAIFILAQELFAGLTEHWAIIFGPALILTVLFLRGGIAPHLGRRGR